jgi:hypothetical protein
MFSKQNFSPDMQPKTAALIKIIPDTGKMRDSRCKTDN